MTTRYAALAICLLAAACGQKPADGNAAATTAEVLPGSISDAMIDLDTSTASPPMAPVRSEPAKKAAPSTSDAAKPEESPTITLPAPASKPTTSGDTE
ncbi:hypothetical protein GGQ88_001097 [Novosphingobium hassiacum]|uniref:Lipoprotein n=1 Tax=Novosphingobium hassiacum TaxID=173676 RepID=A0A7W5ZTU6_9SPHN|nr:hypothetical protein [Novosphingobium hassiacum]MBB3859836.1 hypothetical protein [Novosphingobium hassiacum]